MNINQFTLAERRNFVMRHTLHMAALQQPEHHADYRRYVEAAPEDWVNKAFTQFAEMYENNPDAIRKRCGEPNPPPPTQ